MKIGFKKIVVSFLMFAKHTASQHQNMLVRKFIEKPADGIEARHLKSITANGLPLPSLIKSLQHLRDLRMAMPRDDIETAHVKLEKLKTATGWLQEKH